MKDPADRKKYTLRVRLTAEQREKLLAAAKRAGLELSPWVRSVAIVAAT